MITFDYEGEGVLADDNVIKNIRSFHKFSLNFFRFPKCSSNFGELVN